MLTIVFLFFLFYSLAAAVYSSWMLQIILPCSVLYTRRKSHKYLARLSLLQM